MIVVKEDSYIRGNTVLAPGHTNAQEEHTYEQYKKEKNKIIKKNKQKRVTSKAKILRNILVTFIVGVTLVARYCMLYNMQKELSAVKSSIVSLNKENENLKVELVKYSSLQIVEETAFKKLAMVLPDKNDAIYTNLSKDNIGDNNAKSNVKKQATFTDKIKKLLF